ncbi:hypothetical protein GOP47_0030394 [Adiantum capillus-veneris]|nr:hypothetical protein GOP47_0029982 [Adiantum capillus-veneris]KAI5055249.1 hypothetical protein GOP47_0030394 [Adiantum capillus-veneris]
MDGYRDLLRVPVSAGYYASSRYPVGYSDPLYSYSRAALDAYAGYGAPVSYPPEPVPLPQYAQYPSPRRRMNPRRRPPPQNNNKRRPAPSETLTPKKKSFKKTQKSLHVESFSSKGDLRKGKAPSKLQQKDVEKAKSPASTLAKETEELHKLFRTGVDNGKKIVKPVAKQAAGSPGKKVTSNGVGQKRKADEERKEAPSKKKNKGKKKKKNAKGKKQESNKEEKPVETPKVVKPEPAPLTDEQKKEMELALELQVAACKAVAEFLGIPEKVAEPEAEKSEPAEAAGNEAQEDTPTTDAQDDALPATEAQDKPEEAPKPPALTPEEEKELEEKAFTFFSKTLEENSNLRNLYLEKKDAGTFECLVCHSVDAETSKKFANLTGLVMHTSMRRQKRPEHRGYGKAICDILGWESLRPKRPAKQAKVDGEDTTEVEVEKAVEVTEEKQDGKNDDK